MTEKKITQLQLVSIGLCYVFGTIVVSVFVSAVTGNESWIVGPLAAICFIPTMLVYASITKKFPGKGLFEINEAVFGSIAGHILSGVYLVFFLSLCSLNVLEATNFLYYFIMPDTPLLAIAIFLVAACVYCVRTGLFAIARVSTVFCIAALAALSFSVILSLNHANFDFLFPIFNLKPLDYVQGIHVATSIPFGESIFLLMLVPDLSEKVSIKKSYILVMIATGFLVMMIHFREVVSLGPMLLYTTQPSFESVRLINISDIFSRTESLFALLLVSLTFFKTLILFYITLKGVTQIFRLDSYKHLTIMAAALLTILAIESYGSPSNNIFWGKNVSPFIWTFFTSIIPLITLLSAAVKDRFSFSKKRIGNS